MSLLIERKLSEDSVDTQIDSYIIEFEGKATKGAGSVAENVQNTKRTLMENVRFLLEETDEEEKGSKKVKDDIDKKDEKDKKKKGNAFEEKDKREKGREGRENGGSDKEPFQFKVNVNTPSKPDREPENLDIDEFTSNVARLIENSEDLLSVKKVILSRTLKFLEENYNEDVKNMASLSLKTNFGINIKIGEPGEEEYGNTAKR